MEIEKWPKAGDSPLLCMSKKFRFDLPNRLVENAFLLRKHKFRQFFCTCTFAITNERLFI